MNKKVFAQISLLSLIVFVIIAFFVVNGSFHSFDSSINSAMPGIQNSFLIYIAKVFHYLFSAEVLTIISILVVVWLFIIKSDKKDAKHFATVMIITAAIISILKMLFNVARPLNGLIAERKVSIPFLSSENFSFPSGHAAASTVFFGLIIYYILKHHESKNVKLATIIFSCLAIILVCLSRVYLNVHWASDVFGGFFLGLGILFASIWIFEKKFF